MMPPDNKIRISVITENRNLSDYITLTLRGEGYEVKNYSVDTDALKNLEQEPCNLIISDFRSPTVNGIDIANALRKNFLFRYVPVILILPDDEQLNIARIIYAGADDYLQRSEVEYELMLRVKLNLYRTAREQDIHPLTRLPGQSTLWKELGKRIDSKSALAVYYADLYKFKEFNRRYGFKKGDEVIKYTASLITKSLKDFGSPSDFLSHPQGDDFTFITLPDIVDLVSNKIINDFDKGIPNFYELEDKQKGYILLKNRKGEIEKIPILRIHIGVVTNEHYPLFNPAQVIEIATELKNFCQQSFEKSMYVKERRKTYPSH